MKWQDFLYFSKGERMGLTVLLILITIAVILMIKRNDGGAVTKDETPVLAAVPAKDSVASQKVTISSTPTKPNQQKTKEPKEPKENPENQQKQKETKENQQKPKETKENSATESVRERAARIASYAQPSRQQYPRAEKYAEGTVVELNAADTTTLKKVPGIGSSFAKRIVGYRNLLGGYYSVTQLAEVYGVDEDKYEALIPWFKADPALINKLNVNTVSLDSLNRHPYVDYRQAKIITQLRRQKGKLEGWQNLRLLEEFSDFDAERLQHYFSFD